MLHRVNIFEIWLAHCALFCHMSPFHRQETSLKGHLSTLRPRQNGHRFADDVFKCIFLKFVPKVPINNIPALVQILAWRRWSDKPLSEPMMASLLTHICVTRPQWVKLHSTLKHCYTAQLTLTNIFVAFVIHLSPFISTNYVLWVLTIERVEIIARTAIHSAKPNSACFVEMLHLVQLFLWQRMYLYFNQD